jgi:hypothetical protein
MRRRTRTLRRAGCPLPSSPRIASLARLRIDARRNAVFPHRDDDGVCGYEIKNRGFTGFATGGVKALVALEPKARRLGARRRGIRNRRAQPRGAEAQPYGLLREHGGRMERHHAGDAALRRRFVAARWPRDARLRQRRPGARVRRGDRPPPADLGSRARPRSAAGRRLRLERCFSEPPSNRPVRIGPGWP